VPVVFVDGQPICEGHLHPGDETRGCFFALPTPHIEIATMTFNHRAIGAFLFGDEMAAALAHELRHAIQWRKCGKLSEPIGTTWECVP
jgi:hypothetical protein